MPGSLCLGAAAEDKDMALEPMPEEHGPHEADISGV